MLNDHFNSWWSVLYCYFHSAVEEIVSSDQEKEASKIASLAPARVTIPGDYVVSQIACGLHHSG